MLHVDFLDCDDTVVVENYCGTLTRLWQAVCHNRPGLLHQVIVILRGDAWCHSANQTLSGHSTETERFLTTLSSLQILRPVISMFLDHFKSTWLSSGLQQTLP